MPNHIRLHYYERHGLTAHVKVIRPMLEKSIEAYVYGLTEKRELPNLNHDRDRENTDLTSPRNGSLNMNPCGTQQLGNEDPL